MNLKNLSDHHLHLTLITLARRERAILMEVLWHLREVDRRKLYSDFKCSSLFDYAIKMLKYSEGQASRRVTACRLLRDIPELALEIQSGDLTLTQLGQVNQFFKETGIQSKEEKLDVISQIKGKTTRESEAILWEMKKDDSSRTATIVLKQETLDRLQRIKHLKAHTFKDMDELLVGMAEMAEKQWSPKVTRTKESNPAARYVGVSVKAAVWERDQGQCRNCKGTFALQYDHVKPFSRGGETSKSNIQLLCRNCNQRKGSSYA